MAQSKSAFVFQAWVHGFRMPLFMLVSGFFTAMLWRQKGLKALLWHRCRRVLFPCLLGLVTILPAVTLAAAFASQRNVANKSTGSKVEPAAASIWAAIKLGDAVAVDAHLRNPATLTNLHPAFGFTPLTWAVLTGQNKIASSLLDRGAGIDERNRDGETALHSAAFLGRAEIGDLHLQRGANINSKNAAGETALASAGRDFETVQLISGILGIAVDRKAVEEGRRALIPRLGSKGLPNGGGVVAANPRARSSQSAWSVLGGHLLDPYNVAAVQRAVVPLDARLAGRDLLHLRAGGRTVPLARPRALARPVTSQSALASATDSHPYGDDGVPRRDSRACHALCSSGRVENKAVRTGDLRASSSGWRKKQRVIPVM